MGLSDGMYGHLTVRLNSTIDLRNTSMLKSKSNLNHFHLVYLRELLCGAGEYIPSFSTHSYSLSDATEKLLEVSFSPTSRMWLIARLYISEGH
jgi:hypothetical protein